MVDFVQPWELGVIDAVRLLERRKLSSTELLESCLDRVKACNGGEPSFDGSEDAVNAWVHTYPELARKRAASLDRTTTDMVTPGLFVRGIPIGLKDLIAVAGLPLTASSKVLEGNVSTRDSAAWAGLARDGAVLLGHTQTYEFALAGTCDQVGNPWDLSRSPGGSSGGSAAAVAARMVPAALGTDTAGSVRIPAALCGVSAVKAAYGHVPTTGVIELARSLDHVGVLARTIADCSALLRSLCTGDTASRVKTREDAISRWPTSPRPGTRPLSDVRIALTYRADHADLESEVAIGYEAAIQALRRLGAQIVSPPDAPGPYGDWYGAVFAPEAQRAHTPFRAKWEKYRSFTRATLTAIARDADKHDLEAALRWRKRHSAAWVNWLRSNDITAILEPTVPIVAPVRYPRHLAGPDATERLITFTELWNLTGLPVATLPAGIGASTGLPTSVSLVGAPSRQSELLQVAIDLQATELPAVSLPRLGEV